MDVDHQRCRIATVIIGQYDPGLLVCSIIRIDKRDGGRGYGSGDHTSSLGPGDRQDREMAQHFQSNLGCGPTVGGHGVVSDFNDIVSLHQNIRRNSDVESFAVAARLPFGMNGNRSHRLPVHFDGMRCLCPGYSQYQSGLFGLARPGQADHADDFTSQIIAYGQALQCIRSQTGYNFKVLTRIIFRPRSVDHTRQTQSQDQENQAQQEAEAKSSYPTHLLWLILQLEVSSLPENESHGPARRQQWHTVECLS